MISSLKFPVLCCEEREGEGAVLTHTRDTGGACTRNCTPSQPCVHLYSVYSSASESGSCVWVVKVSSSHRDPVTCIQDFPRSDPVNPHQSRIFITYFSFIFQLHVVVVCYLSPCLFKWPSYYKPTLKWRSVSDSPQLSPALSRPDPAPGSLSLSLSRLSILVGHSETDVWDMRRENWCQEFNCENT